MTIALTRPVSAFLARCELTHLVRTPINVERAREQHAAYEDTLRSLGVQVIRAPEAPDSPDAVFIEDTAVVLDELAVIARPGAASRQAETEAVVPLLAEYRSVRRIKPPATLDGGDVLRIGRTVYVGASSRTNADGIAQLGEILGPAGYTVVPVPVTGCLHLKSAVTEVARRVVLVNPRGVQPEVFADCEVVTIAERERGAANALLIGDAVIYPTHFPETMERLARHGLAVVPIEYDELAKAEGGVTCCSLLLHGTPPAQTSRSR